MALLAPWQSSTKLWPQNRKKPAHTMAFTISKTLDHGTANPVVARLALQIFDILKSCNIAKDLEEGILRLCMESLVPGLLRCWEIRERYELEFQRQIESYKKQVPNVQVIEVPSITTLDQDCRNFLYEAKNFLRDLMQLFNFLYGTKFKDASDYLPPKGRKAKLSCVEFRRTKIRFAYESAARRPSHLTKSHFVNN
jgi:hypothetical protein